ncbi:hypothetical protein Rhe02_13270 [Rhizocola hellebori]|uniref:Uncharacterized protein n=1 Tax=Rhizocola hellebori TaxID=1392758 RepID=A0A8J3Q4U8_9ACTN|nr:hypothetical protein Rhe02_13270 [Rhizocola hellebori]
MKKHAPRRAPISPAHAELGRELRRVREAAARTMRDIGGYSSGHISNVENGHVMPSMELVETYARIGGDRVRIIGAYEAARRTTSTRRKDRQNPMGLTDPEPITAESPPDLIRGSYRVEDSEAYYFVDQKRIIREQDVIYKIRAKDRDVPYFISRRIYYSDPTLNALSITAGVGCQLARTAHDLTGEEYILLELDAPARPQDTAPQTISLNVKVNSDVPSVPMVRYSSGPETARRAVRVKFSSPELPSRVWWFRSSRLSPWAEIDPGPDQLLARSPSGLYFWDFFDLENEYVGLAWNWDGPYLGDDAG